MRLGDDAVYTILHPKQLAGIATGGKPVTLRETKRWVTAKRLFDNACEHGVAMIVFYADAAHDCSKLIFWGQLTQLDVDATGTNYTVANLTPLAGHRTQELVLRSSNETIAEGYLRPYAVVRTPSFIQQVHGSAPNPGGTCTTPSEDTRTTLFSFGYRGAGSATGALVSAANQAEACRGFESPLWVDIRISRSVRATGFRDRAFERLLGADYVWMPDLGNVCVREHRDGIEIRKPAAADKLLDHALGSPSRRVIFFCSCKLPGLCHRRTVAALVKGAAERRGIDVNVVEWPGGEAIEISLNIPVVVLHAVARHTLTTIAVPDAMHVGLAASLPWGTRAVLTAGEETLAVLVGPAVFTARGAHLNILSVNPGPSNVFAVRNEHGYEC